MTRGARKVERVVDMDAWGRGAQFALFRGYAQPHFAVTARVDVTAVMAAKVRGVSVNRACLFGIGAGLHAVSELCMRFRGDQVVRHDRIDLSMSVPSQDGGFAYAYVPFDANFAVFDAQAAAAIARAAAGGLNPHAGGDDVAYLSCLPWLDYTSINNALPGPQDCIPRVSWGKIVPLGAGFDMAMTLEVHHALVDGAQVGAYFAAVQAALDAV